MKKSLILLYTSVLVLIVYSCDSPVMDEVKKEVQDITKDKEEEIPENEDYDSTYAAELGADVYGMKSYVLAFLKKGPNRDQDSLEAIELQQAHMANIGRLAEEGVLVLAGPFNDNSDFQGIYIFDVETVEEAEELTKTDPAIKAGRLVMELHPWYGSAGLKEVNDIHKKIAKIYI